MWKSYGKETLTLTMLVSQKKSNPMTGPVVGETHLSWLTCKTGFKTPCVWSIPGAMSVAKAQTRDSLAWQAGHLCFSRSQSEIMTHFCAGPSMRHVHKATPKSRAALIACFNFMLGFRNASGLVSHMDQKLIGGWLIRSVQQSHLFFLTQVGNKGKADGGVTWTVP